MNLRMREKIANRDAIDVRRVGDEVTPGVFALRTFIEDVDYCDGRDEQWIWSIGRRKTDGKIFASTDARYYQHPDYECLFLR